jgi:gluconate kinase
VTKIDQFRIVSLITAHATSNLAAAWEDGDAVYNGANSMLMSVGRALQSAGLVTDGMEWSRSIDTESHALTTRK